MERTDITLQTKIFDLLEDYPSLEALLLERSSVFSKLKNPILRRTVARVTSLQQAAEVAGISPIQLVQELRLAAGLTSFEFDSVDEDDKEEVLRSAPDWFAEERINVVFDARPVLDAGGSPMSEILRLASELKSEDILQLTTSFKPQPIIDILKSKGFEIWSNGVITYICNRKN